MAKTAEEASALAAETLAKYPKDVPFALIYLIAPDGDEARLAGAAGITPGEVASPQAVRLDDGGKTSRGWPLAEILRSQAPLAVGDLAARFDCALPGPWPDPPTTAVLVPIRSAAAHRLAGVLIAGVSPRLPLDELYRSFLDLAGTQIAGAVASARAYEEERRRAEALAEIDRAKTAFFSNVSHEFRTPLTLMLSPMEDLLLRGADGSALTAERGEVELMHRNGLRLLKLVNTLLDFSRIEAGRMQAVYEPVDLAAPDGGPGQQLSFGDANAPGSAIAVDCEPLGEPVYVDPRHVGEDRSEPALQRLQIHLDGRGGGHPAPASRARPSSRFATPAWVSRRGAAALVRALSSGRGAAGAHQEGTGIGLALVQELVRMQGGRVAVDSSEGRGSRFTVTIPLGTAHLPAERIGATSALASTEIGAAALCRGGAAVARYRNRQRAGHRATPRPAPCRSRRCRWCCWPTTTPTCGTTCGGC